MTVTRTSRRDRRRRWAGNRFRAQRRAAYPGQRRRQKHAVRWLVGAAVLVGGLLTPVDSVDLGDHLGTVIGSRPIAAQSGTIVDGMLGSCPTSPIGWTQEGSNCVIEIAPCPPNPLPNGGLMKPSRNYPDVPGVDKYPEFCEVRVLELTDQPSYDACVNTSQGYVVKQYDEERLVDGELELFPGCRLITSPICADGLHRVDRMSCRAVQRLPWSCNPGEFPTNTFNKCYVPSSVVPDPHPVCGQGAPTMVAVSCAVYVQDDYLQIPSSVACSSFDTGDPTAKLRLNSKPGVSSDHWCEFDSTRLIPICHGTSPPASVCSPPTVATCLKRVSRSGGCDAIAATIRCRALQAEYSAGSIDADTVRRDGCAPCVVLPFQAVPAGCPDDLLLEPDVVATRGTYHDALHRVRDDFNVSYAGCAAVVQGGDLADYPACDAKKVCSDPPEGRLSWVSNHASQQAIVNSPVTLVIDDLASETTTVQGFVSSSLGTYIERVRGRRLLRYPDSSPGDSHILQFPQLIPNLSYRDVGNLVGFAVSYPILGSACSLADEPRVLARIELLWPDRDETEIEDRFGARSLDWWHALSVAERRDKTLARGLKYWGDLTTSSAQIEENEHRADALTEIVPCHTGASVWCRWLPTQSGYYRVVGASSWVVSQYISDRFWELPQRVQNMSDFIRDNSASLRSDIADIGLPAKVFGINDSVTALLPIPSGLEDDWLYSEAAGERVRCPSMDLRVHCSGTGTNGNYTETAPIGVLVHEIRVVTRTPSS